MKKRIAIILISAFALWMINYFVEDSTRTSVYTRKSASEIPLYLYVDNQYIGELPSLVNDDKNDRSSGKALDLQLKHGTHVMTAKDKNGKDVSSLKIEVASFKTSSWGLTGSHSQSVRGLLSRRIYVDMF